MHIRSLHGRCCHSWDFHNSEHCTASHSTCLLFMFIKCIHIVSIFHSNCPTPQETVLWGWLPYSSFNLPPTSSLSKLPSTLPTFSLSRKRSDVSKSYWSYFYCPTPQENINDTNGWSHQTHQRVSKNFPELHTYIDIESLPAAGNDMVLSGKYWWT